MPSLRLQRILLSTTLTLLFALSLHPVSADAERERGAARPLPPGFAVTLLSSGLSAPVDMAFLPSGDILVAQKGHGDETTGWSHLRLIRNGVLEPDPIFTLSSTTINDSGIFGIALDPGFADNGHIYVWYATGVDAPNTPPKPVNRLIRLTLNAEDGSIDPESYTIVIDNIPHSDWHNGGGMLFDSDGTLYLATGDAEMENLAQELTTLNGKVLRIRPTDDGYEIPEDNPFFHTPGARPEIYAVGLRNPWRMTRNAADGALYVSDVGSKMWEELNRVQPRANYGWDNREGPCPTGQQLPCAPGSSKYTMPVLYYPHPNGGKSGGAITGIAFYNGDAYPHEYRGKLFFADFDQSYVATGDLGPDGGLLEEFYGGVDSIVDIEYFRNNIYWLDIRSRGVYMLHYTESANVAPTASLSSDTDGGAAPLTVRFSAADSVDPDDAVLTYILTPGDGSPVIRSPDPEIDHTYESDGTYSATLQVEDIRGGLSAPVSQEITVYSGEWPTIALENQTEPRRSLFHGGDTIAFVPVRAAGTDGLHRDVPYLWRIDLLHNEHSHPELIDMAAVTGTLTIPTANHGGDADLAYRFSLTMQTAGGQQVPVKRDLLPAVEQITIESSPSGFGLVQIGSEPHLYPHTFDAIVGTEYDLRAAGELLTVDGVWRFDGWSSREAGEKTEDPALVLSVPVGGAHLHAHYRYVRPSNRVYLPYVAQR